MNKKSIISFFLLFAFTFLLAHNFIPHYHNEDTAESEHHAHHHDSDNHHKKNQDKESEKHNGDEHDSFFSHTNFLFTHSELSYNYSKRKDSKKTHPTVNLNTITENRYRQFKIPIKRKIHFLTSKNLSQSYYYSFSYRGPPSIS